MTTAEVLSTSAGGTKKAGPAFTLSAISARQGHVAVEILLEVWPFVSTSGLPPSPPPSPPLSPHEPPSPPASPPPSPPSTLYDVICTTAEVQLDVKIASQDEERQVMNREPVPFEAAVALARSTFTERTLLQPDAIPGATSSSGFVKMMLVVSSRDFRYQFYMGDEQVDGTPTGWNDFAESTWARLTNLYSNRACLGGAPLCVKSGYFTYELTFIEPNQATSAHSFASAPIAFAAEERAAVVAVQRNTESGTRRTVRRVLEGEEVGMAFLRQHEKDEFTESPDGFRKEMDTHKVPWSVLQKVDSVPMHGADGAAVHLEEKMAARAYTGDWIYSELNNQLRKAGGAEPPPADFRHCTRYLQRAVHTMGLPRGVGHVSTHRAHLCPHSQLHLQGSHCAR